MIPRGGDGGGEDARLPQALDDRLHTKRKLRWRTARDSDLFS